MPGVIVVESLAHAGGILLYHSVPNPETVLVFLTTINNAKFRKPIVPGDQLKLEVEILKLKSKYSYISGKVFVDGELVAEAEIMASFTNLEELNERE
jgi:3-hydroxyacyl-[acyl-carrier-protein] dehydratase/UDP-3-O-[3-hydroxymyristoyl] N-acetylglucosamine deacetylase/3-hydroxyacyl-[acyl-carrier-protein] dehydratase